MLPPLHPSHIRHAKPGLIDVEESIPSFPHLDEFQRPLLSKDYVLDRVRVIGSLQDLSVAHAKFVGHHSPHKIGFDVHAYLIFYAPADALSRVDDLVFLQHFIYDLLDDLYLHAVVLLLELQSLHQTMVLELFDQS